MADNIKRINSEKLAIHNKLYYDKDSVYIGLPNGRLEKLRQETKITKNNSESDLLNKTFYYDSSDNIVLIEEYNSNNLQRSKRILYDSSGNITKIIVSGSETYTKNFRYNSSGNLTSININNNV